MVNLNMYLFYTCSWETFLNTADLKIKDKILFLMMFNIELNFLNFLTLDNSYSF